MNQNKKSRGGNAQAHLAFVALGFCAVMLLLCGVLSGCSANQGGESSQPAQNSKTLHAGSTTYFYAESLDPASDWNSWYLSYYGIVENLFRVSNDLTPEPWLAKSATRQDDYTWVIELNDNIQFSNGEPLNAQAVKNAWERTYEENARAQETLPYEELKAEDNTLTIRTSEKLPSLENVLCDPLLCVYYVGSSVEDYAKDTPGTGPYKTKTFSAEDEIVLEPNMGYWSGTPKLSQITLTCFTDDNALTMAMQNGEIQAVAMPSASTAATLGSNDYTRIANTSSRADFIRMNMTHSVIQNDAIRTAVAYCIDREGYANTICQGSSVPSWGVYSKTLPFGGTEGLDVTVSSCDVEAAQALLDGAGISDSDGDGVRELDGKPVSLTLYTCTNYERFVQLADDLQSKLQEAGIELKIVPTDYFLEDAETFAKDDPDMTLDSYAMAPTGNPAYFASIAFATDASNNFGKYSNKQVDSLVSTLNATYDENERNNLARQIAQQVLTDVSYIFFANTESVVICDKNVVGLDASPSEYYFVTVDTDVQ